MQIKNLIRKIRELFRLYPLLGSIAAVSFTFGLSGLSGQILRMFPESIPKDYLIPCGSILSVWLVVLLFGYQWCYRYGSVGKTILISLPLILLMGYSLVSTMYSAFSAPDVKWLPVEGIILGILKLSAVFGAGA